MEKVQEKIASVFLDKLGESPDVTPQMIEHLRTLLSAKRKMKADDLVEVFSPPPGGDIA